MPFSLDPVELGGFFKSGNVTVKGLNANRMEKAVFVLLGPVQQSNRKLFASLFAHRPASCPWCVWQFSRVNISLPPL